MNYLFAHEDEHLQQMIERLGDREGNDADDTDNGLQMYLSKEDFLAITEWTENSYSTNSLSKKKMILESHGFLVHDTEGKGAEMSYHVTMTNNAWYYLLLLGEYRQSEAVNAYLHTLFTGNGYLELGGSHLAATLGEFAQKFAEQFNETPVAVKRKLNRIRIPLKKYDYLITGRESAVHQIRVRKYGYDTYLTGPCAILMDYVIRREFAGFYQRMEEKYGPITKDTPLSLRKHIKKVIEEEKEEFITWLKRKHRVNYIRSHYASTLSLHAQRDYNAIQILLLKGATFTEIRQFLAERPAYYELEKEREKQRKEIPMEEILRILFEKEA